MSHIENGGPPRLRQDTQGAYGQTLPISQRDFAPPAFNLNQIGFVCLPLSTNKKFIWVENQMYLQPEVEAELNKAFDSFPYMTQKETEELAQHCSLHPDQVRLWFMIQRLLNGISWDCKDICELQRQFKSNLGKNEPQNSMREEAKEDSGELSIQEKEGNESGEIKAGEVRKENECVTEERNTEIKQKLRTSTDRMRKNRKCGLEETIMEGVKGAERRRDKVKRQWQTRKRLPPLNKWPVLVSDERLDESSPSKDTTVAAGGSQEVAVHPTRIRSKNKTQTQVVLMRRAFARCQYPDSECYGRLTEQIGISREVLVQWFGDMRYYIKKGKPGWMNEEQHSQALANINSRQFLKTLEKEQANEGEPDKSSDDDESVQ